MSSSTYSPCSDDTVSRVLDQPASLAGVLINVEMIAAIREEETAVLRHRESKNRLLDGDETFRTCIPPSLIREDQIGKKAKPHEAHLSFNARMFRAMANALPWDNPAFTEVHFVSEAFRQLSHDEQISLHGPRHLLKVLLITRPFTDAEGNEARILPPRACDGPALDIYATKKKVTDTSNLPEFLPDDDADEEAATSDQEDDNLPAGPVVPGASSAASTQSQNFFTNPLPRNMEHAGLHPQ